MRIFQRKKVLLALRVARADEAEAPAGDSRSHSRSHSRSPIPTLKPNRPVACGLWRVLPKSPLRWSLVVNTPTPINTSDSSLSCLHWFCSGGSHNGFGGGNSAFSVTSAYAKGYQDGKGGKPYDAPVYTTSHYTTKPHYNTSTTVCLSVTRYPCWWWVRVCGSR